MTTLNRAIALWLFALPQAVALTALVVFVTLVAHGDTQRAMQTAFGLGVGLVALFPPVFAVCGILFCWDELPTTRVLFFAIQREVDLLIEAMPTLALAMVLVVPLGLSEFWLRNFILVSSSMAFLVSGVMTVAMYREVIRHEQQ